MELELKHLKPYLRSESFALPYNGFSVKRQVVEGVISVIKQSPVLDTEENIIQPDDNINPVNH